MNNLQFGAVINGHFANRDVVKGFQKVAQTMQADNQPAGVVQMQEGNGGWRQDYCYLVTGDDFTTVKALIDTANSIQADCPSEAGQLQQKACEHVVARAEGAEQVPNEGSTLSILG